MIQVCVSILQRWSSVRLSRTSRASWSHSSGPPLALAGPRQTLCLPNIQEINSLGWSQFQAAELICPDRWDGSRSVTLLGYLAHTQIDHTDRLIDQVVYRLYGLTEEEITVVEDAH